MEGKMDEPKIVSSTIPPNRQTQIKSVLCRIGDILEKDLESDIERFIVTAVLGATLQHKLREEGIGLLVGAMVPGGRQANDTSQDASEAEQELAARFAKFVGKTGQA
jgi:hypothetical protein